MPKPKTNIDFVRELMDFSRFGALAQMFVIDALSKWSAKIAETPIEELRAAVENPPLINAEAWHRAWHARSRTSWIFKGQPKYFVMGTRIPALFASLKFAVSCS